jgi:hypothetical protein
MKPGLSPTHEVLPVIEGLTIIGEGPPAVDRVAVLVEAGEDPTGIEHPPNLPIIYLRSLIAHVKIFHMGYFII